MTSIQLAERTRTAFDLSVEDMAFIRAVTALTGVKQTRILRDGALAEGRRIAEMFGCLDEAETQARKAAKAVRR